MRHRAEVTVQERDADAVAAYLPDNYRVTSVTEPDSRGRVVVTFEGEDKAGWTYDGYVEPRLASGLYFAHEVPVEDEPFEPETGQAFAARHWGGEDTVAVKSNVTYGRRELDGGRPRYPAGWAFQGDGFTYRVWVKATEEGGQVWQVEANDGGYATFVRHGHEWVVTEGWSDRVTRVPARDTPLPYNWQPNEREES